MDLNITKSPMIELCKKNIHQIQQFIQIELWYHINHMARLTWIYHEFSFFFFFFFSKWGQSLILNIWRNMFKKKVPFLAKAWHWCLHLHLDHSKFDLSSWVILFVPMVKLKDWSFQFWRSHQKQTNKAFRWYSHFFTKIFMILVEHSWVSQILGSSLSFTLVGYRLFFFLNPIF